MPTSPTLTKPEHLPSRVWAALVGWLWAWIGWIAVGAAVAATMVYFGTPYVLGPIVVTDQIKRQDVIQTVVASGQVQTPYRMNLAAQVIGTVADVPVAEGQTVQAGTLLVRLDDREAREAVRLAQGVVEQSQARLQQLTAVTAPTAAETRKQAEAALKNAQAAYDRTLRLQQQGFGTGATLDDARKALDVAQSQVHAADIQVASAMPGGMDYLMAQTQLGQAEAGLHSAEAKLGYYQIKAPRDGTLISRSVERGNTVQPGATLMVLAPAGETQIVVQIDEVNLGLLQLGQKVTVSADAYPKQVFEARLSYINPSIDPQRGSVEVKLTVANPPDYLRQDMTVSVEIEVARRQQAIVVDSGSVHDLSGSRPWVLVVEAGRARRRGIKVGTIGDAAVEVLAGVQPGDVVVRGQMTSLTDGQRVRTNGNG